VWGFGGWDGVIGVRERERERDVIFNLLALQRDIGRDAKVWQRQ
jgi:hypothetical protein